MTTRSSRLIFAVACAWSSILGLAAASISSSISNTAPIPPVVQYLTDSDLAAARQLAKERHQRAVQDALTNFPIDDIPCTASDDEAAVDRAHRLDL